MEGKVLESASDDHLASHLCAVAGSALLLVPMGFALAKRTGRGGSPPRWFVAHVAAATAGLVLVAGHTSGRLERPPALLLLALVGLALTGAVARVRLSADIAATFGTKRAPFRALDADRRDALRRLIQRKIEVLAELDPVAGEATFSVTLAHCIRAPRLASAYARLVRQENRLMGTRHSVGAAQAYWRPLHLVLAYGFVIGLLIHIVVVTLFAGYAAGDRDIYWWHIAAW